MFDQEQTKIVPGTANVIVDCNSVKWTVERFRQSFFYDLLLRLPLVIWSILLAMVAGVRITPEMATCLYTAVLTDTGSFCYDGTDAHTFELAAELVRHGARSAAIAKDVYFSHPTSKMLLLGAALSTLRREGRIAWMWVTHDDMVRTSAAEEDCEGLANYAIAISGVDVAIFLRELSNHRVRLSLRSKGDVNVARIAERFGGGGHQHASGCTLDGPLPEATEMIVEVARRTLSAAVHEVA